MTEDKANNGGMFSLFKKGLNKTGSKLTRSIGNVLPGKKSIDSNIVEQLEEVLISSDIGVRATTDIVEHLENSLKRSELNSVDDVYAGIKSYMIDALDAPISNDEEITASPHVILVVGVNGGGKTTSIAKLAHHFKSNGKSVLLAAGDTYRAAADTQLSIWADRLDVPIVLQGDGSDAASVIYDAVVSAKSKNIDIVLCDTAGRLHTKKNLMDELAKIVRVIKKEIPEAPHEVLVTLDASGGQNSVTQAKVFGEICKVTGAILTKLDGTAKGGVAVSVAKDLNIPIKYVGFGETLEDLQQFDSRVFVEAIFDQDEDNRYKQR